jgi:hypothetical protein
LNLSRDPLTHGVVGGGVEPAGVDEGDSMAVKQGVGVVPIARDTGLVVNDGQSLARKSIKQ